jgi:hypothetical protein
VPSIASLTLASSRLKADRYDMYGSPLTRWPIRHQVSLSVDPFQRLEFKDNSPIACRKRHRQHESKMLVEVRPRGKRQTSAQHKNPPSLAGFGAPVNLRSISARSTRLQRDDP